jgi:hypothetical protein
MAHAASHAQPGNSHMHRAYLRTVMSVELLSVVGDDMRILRATA